MNFCLLNMCDAIHIRFVLCAMFYAILSLTLIDIIYFMLFIMRIFRTINAAILLELDMPKAL